MSRVDCTVAVVGAGITGIAAAYYLCVAHKVRDVVLIDPNPPMSFTSAQSGENYRNWWPHPVMTAFTDDSIDLMEQVARDSGNRLNMTRRGYALATRENPDALIEELHRGYGANADTSIRIHAADTPDTYHFDPSAGWENSPDGVDVLCDQDIIRRTFPTYADDISTVIHIRRAGDISGQQLGQYMLECLRASGGRLITGSVVSIDPSDGFILDVGGHDEIRQIRCGKIVNAAGPFAGEIAKMVGVMLPVTNVFQQKIAFEDRAGVIPRTMPFSIDLDAQFIDWSDEETELLRQDSQIAWLTERMPGAIHCRPDGGEHGRWIKLGWAYEKDPTAVQWEPQVDGHFPEIVLRGASRLNPGLKTYYGALPRQMTHYGGYYTMTDENWPLIGPMGVEGSYVAGALSGFGTMAACAAGSLCAKWLAGDDLPDYAADLSLARYENTALLAGLAEMQSKGVL
jgi:glycine/D-amino acid oxidase-like deaminating enzyme